MSETRVFTAGDVAGLLPVSDCIHALEAALREGGTVHSFVGGVATRDGAGKFHLKSALGSGARPLFAAKLNANFPDNPRLRSLPTIQGVLALFDATEGRLLALMDSSSITVIRTAAATGVAAKYLAKPDASAAAIIGCGAQARSQLEALCAIRAVREARLFDTDHTKAAAFASEVRESMDVTVEVSDDIHGATRGAHMVVTSTPSRQAFLRKVHVNPGTFIAAVGSDNPDKNELHADLIAQSMVIVDDLEQCATMGDLHHAISAGLVDRSHAAGTLTDLVAHPERFAWRSDRTVVFDSTGIPLEDVVAAGLVYERAANVSGGTIVHL